MGPERKSRRLFEPRSPIISDALSLTALLCFPPFRGALAIRQLFGSCRAALENRQTAEQFCSGAPPSDSSSSSALSRRRMRDLPARRGNKKKGSEKKPTLPLLTFFFSLDLDLFFSFQNENNSPRSSRSSPATSREARSTAPSTSTAPRSSPASSARRRPWSGSATSSSRRRRCARRS